MVKKKKKLPSISITTRFKHYKEDVVAGLRRSGLDVKEEHMSVFQLKLMFFAGYSAVDVVNQIITDITAKPRWRKIK